LNNDDDDDDDDYKCNVWVYYCYISVGDFLLTINYSFAATNNFTAAFLITFGILLFVDTYDSQL
jgi:hypothetical protein